MIITISGDLGSGKSTVSKLLAEKLGYPRHYAGQIWRDLARERNVTLYELHKIGETDPSIDQEVDKRTIDLGKNENDFIFDSHLAWHFIPNSLKVFLKTSPEEAAQRVLQDFKENPDRNSNESDYKNQRDAVIGLEKRKATNIKRWYEIYGVNIHDLKNYDLIIDTTDIPIDQVVEKILDSLPKK